MEERVARPIDFDPVIIVSDPFGWYSADVSLADQMEGLPCVASVIRDDISGKVSAEFRKVSSLWLEQHLGSGDDGSGSAVESTVSDTLSLLGRLDGLRLSSLCQLAWLFKCSAYPLAD